jgi:hypothetical protein
MTRSIVLAALLVALPAAGAEQPKTSGATTTKAPAQKGAKPAASAKGAETKKDPASKASPASKSATAEAAKSDGGEDRKSMLRLRSVFGYAAEACGEGRDRCDRELLDNSEQNFVNACRACDTVDRCEAERVAIRGGTTSSNTDLCLKQ